MFLQESKNLSAGIQTEKQLVVVNKLGVDISQGYFYSNQQQNTKL